MRYSIHADGLFLIEVDRVLRPGGYFVWTSPLTNARNKVNQKRWNHVHDVAENLCWELLTQQDETVVWKKTTKRSCYFSRSVINMLIWKLLFCSFQGLWYLTCLLMKCLIFRKPGSGPNVCGKGLDIESPYYRMLQTCIGGTHSDRWLPIEEKLTWPSRAKLNEKELQPHGKSSCHCLV